MHILYVIDKMQKFESSLKMSSPHSELTKHCTKVNLVWSFFLMGSKREIFGQTSTYHTRAIITRGLYIFTQCLKTISLCSRNFFQKILPLCMVSIQERFVIKSGLWWRAYGKYIFFSELDFKFDAQKTIRNKLVISKWPHEIT